MKWFPTSTAARGRRPRCTSRLLLVDDMMRLNCEGRGSYCCITRGIVVAPTEDGCGDVLDVACAPRPLRSELSYRRIDSMRQFSCWLTGHRAALPERSHASNTPISSSAAYGSPIVATPALVSASTSDSRSHPPPGSTMTSTPSPAAPIGSADDGVVVIDLLRDGPHG